MLARICAIALLATFAAFGPGPGALAQGMGGDGGDRSGGHGTQSDRLSGPVTIRHIPVLSRDGGGQIMIDTVVVTTNWSVYAARTERGVVQDSLNKLPWVTDIPLIGGLFGADRPSGDLGPEQEVGDTFIQGDTLVISIRPVVDGSQVHTVLLPNDLQRIFARLDDLDEQEPAPPDHLNLSDPTQTPIDIDDILIAHRDSSFRIKIGNFARISANPGDTFMLGGLDSSPVARRDVKIPALGDTPMASYLFRGNTYREERQLIVMITPTIIEPDIDD